MIRLQELIDEHGEDREVRFLNDDHDWFIPIIGVEPANIISVEVKPYESKSVFVLNYE